MGQHRTAVLVAADFDADDRQGMYHRNSSAMSSLLKPYCFVHWCLISASTLLNSPCWKKIMQWQICAAPCRRSLSKFTLASIRGGEYFPHVPASTYIIALRDVLVQHDLHALFVKLSLFMPSEYRSLQQLFDMEEPYVLAPLAVAACMYAAENNLPQPDYPTTAEAFRILMWARDAALQTPYLNALRNIWCERDEALQEQARSAMVEATCQLHAATDGTAAARLLRMHEQYVALRAELHNVSRRFDAQLRELTRLAALLDQRLPRQHRDGLQPADAEHPSTSRDSELRMQLLTAQLQAALAQIERLQQHVGMIPE
jgi:hypothetical protein